ncbi:MAG: metallophosphoesterase [Gammaproteobacteria bacterium]|nr:metallophosphoesterase [Gammaproteobacteria bacterium]
MKFVTLRKRLLKFGALLLAGILSSCQLNLADRFSNKIAEEVGEVYIAITDAQGDFSLYDVDVNSITLTKRDGSVVETLPVKTRIDFSQYVDMTELVTAARIGSGDYTSATMTLDYSNAEIRVEDINGDAVLVSDIRDSSNNPVTEWKVKVDLDRDKPLRIFPGVPAHLSLDFDLKASHSIEYDSAGTPVALTVEPVLIADLDPQTSKAHRLRGVLNKVDVVNNTFDVFMRPFHHKLDKDHGFGGVTVSVATTTTFDINGENYAGEEGISALDALPVLSAVVVKGDLNLKERKFMATEVKAGNSVPGGELDVVQGSVVGRVGNLLTVKGATLIRAGGTVVFNDRVDVVIAETTRVHKQGSHEDFLIDDISIGQRIVAIGTVGDSSTAGLSLDASLGRVALHYTDVHGTRVENTSSRYALVMDVQAINHRRIEAFDFAGTGIDAANDADPQNYEINSGALDVASISTGSPVKVRGFVTPFASAPADFEAVSVVDVAKVRAILVSNWLPSSDNAISEFSAQGITLNMVGNGKFHHVVRNGNRTDLLDTTAAPNIVPVDEERGLWAIVEGQTRTVHTRFEEFVTDLELRLSQQTTYIRSLSAVGQYDDQSARLDATRVRVILE